MKTLEHKIALVAGASSGIGRAAARLFAAEGACVVVGARRAEPLRELVEEIERDGGRACALAGDVADEDYARQLAQLARDKYGGLDIALNNAGTLGKVGPITEIPLEDWRRTLDVNLTSAYLAAKHQVPLMIARGGGSLIFTSTFVGHTAGFPGLAAYAASKAGLTGLTQVLAAEHGRQGVRVNALMPGATDTEMGRQYLNTPEARAYVTSLYALKRMAAPEEIAQAALFLASDASSFVTGTSFLADGGVSINRA
jgi:NAD(P)-dependent dehydrogenase (short-subunit alcohol dehydrogenase family)